MAFIRNHLSKAKQEAFLPPAARFVTDFTGLLTAVDRLMVDIGSVTETERDTVKPNGEARAPTLNGTISTLREHAQSFVRSLKNFELLLDRIPVPFMELDGKARILRTNEECAEMLNGSAAPLSGKSLFNFVSSSDSKRLRDYLAIARQTNKPCVAHLSIAQSGGYRPVELRLRRQLVGSEVGYVAVVDSTHQLRDGSAVIDLKHDGDPSINQLVINLCRAETVKTMADTVGSYCGRAFRSPAGLIFVEQRGDLQLVTQWHSQQIPKKHMFEEITRKGPVALAFRTGEPVFWRRGRVPRSTVGRRLYRLLGRCPGRGVTFLPIRAPGKRPVGVLVMVLSHADDFLPVLYDDLAQLGRIVSGCIVRARAYDEAIAARVRAENALRNKDEFLSVLSHELKNPMMPILGWAVALSSGTLPAEKQNLALEGIVRNVRALNYLVEDLFDAVRISSGKISLELAETRIQDVAREALAAIQHMVESKKLRISTDISEAIPAFMVDSRRLHQVLVNLLNNAVKFTPEGGSIALRVYKRDDIVECIVSDTGQGIERKFLPFVFDRFRQENRSSKARATGLGLGLAIVREIVEIHGGSIEVFSEGTDKGSTFTLRLPMRRKHGRGELRQPSANESRAALRKKISKPRE